MTPKLRALTPNDPNEPGQEVEAAANRAVLTAEVKSFAAVEETGYLVSKDGRLHVQAFVMNDDGEKELGLLPWGNFDARALGTIIEPDGTRSYLVRITVGDREHHVTLDHMTLADARKLAVELNRWPAVIVSPATAWPQIASPARFTLFLDATSPGEAFAVPHLGWHDEAKAFVTPDHVIRAGAHVPGWEAGAVPSRRVAKLSDQHWKWGFDHDWATAQRVLREVLEWQDPTVAAVFGAWWAACLLKGQTIRRTALFPFFGVEIPGGSGKSKGFFESMVELSGNLKGPTNPTPAALRNAVSTSRSGIVWVDDVTDPAKHHETLRASTAEGDLPKSGADMESNTGFPLLAPILLSGTGLAFGGQAELRERVILLHPPKVTSRTSLKPGREGKSQYEDVIELRAEFEGGFTQLAGWYVQEALRHADEYLAKLKNAPRAVTGRVGDKLAILAAGAWLLDQLTENGTWAQDLVAVWSSAVAESTLEADNTLTTEVIPWALRRFGAGQRGEMVEVYGFGRVVPPVLVDPEPEGSVLTPRVYVNTTYLSDYRAREHRNDPNYERLYSPGAMAQQLGGAAMDRKEGTGARISVTFKGEGRFTYAQLKPEYAEAVLARWQQSAGEDQ
ncbi:Arm DNA-binding domain-containing protein [Microbacterium azadirachtae]|uniref:Arm DNA-binding domain-containing protein n=1 Tax=Microbacterium azadirachtae TaxID=582680 RepID=UPI0021D4DBDA|nr:Arm DNA-binding domain-containing protein [Microbacterium azadirachtae]UXW85104.1 Arm DNA-binding domain-containing protein [Microbacterium azadirachtae]